MGVFADIDNDQEITQIRARLGSEGSKVLEATMEEYLRQAAALRLLSAALRQLMEDKDSGAPIEQTQLLSPRFAADSAFGAVIIPVELTADLCALLLKLQAHEAERTLQRIEEVWNSLPAYIR